MTKHKSYAEKLRDPRWQRKRLETMQRADFTCEWCGDKTTTLHVHHGYYARGYEPWDYEEDTLYCLCESCHQQAENLKHDLHLKIAKVHPEKHAELLRAILAWKENNVAVAPRSKVAGSGESELKPVIIVGVANGEISETGFGVQEFQSLEDALKTFPDLNPEEKTKRFTWAMKETKGDAVVRLRFETWKACELYSM